MESWPLDLECPIDGPALGGKHICQRENWKYADLFTKSSKTNNVLSSVNEMRKFVLENEEK